MIKKALTKPLDEVLLVCSLLKRLNAGNMLLFKDRLRTQKVQYLAQLFGIAPSYDYNLYVRGPYSPKLANDMYVAKRAKLNTVPFVSEELESRFKKLEKFLDGKDNRFLELIATLHWLRYVAKLSLGESLEKLSKLKNPNEIELENTLSAVEELPC